MCINITFYFYLWTSICMFFYYLFLYLFMKKCISVFYSFNNHTGPGNNPSIRKNSAHRERTRIARKTAISVYFHTDQMYQGDGKRPEFPLFYFCPKITIELKGFGSFVCSAASRRDLPSVPEHTINGKQSAITNHSVPQGSIAEMIIIMVTATAPP